MSFWCWSSNTLATWYKQLTHWKRPWCWERLNAWGGGDDRGRDGWMASLTQWTWAWVKSGIWWWTGKPGMLQSMGLQRVGHDWTTELNWTDSTPSSIHGGWFQERLLQGTAETAHSIKHCTCFFLCLSVQSVSHVWLFAYIPMIKFNLQIRQRD